MTHSHLNLRATPYLSCIPLPRGHLGSRTAMKLINEKSFVSVERFLKMDSSSTKRATVVCRRV